MIFGWTLAPIVASGLAGAFLLGGGTSIRWEADRGEVLYALWCARCHGRDARGAGPDASLFAEPPPALVGTLVLARYDDADLYAWVREGKKLDLGLRPDALREQSRRTEALHRHLRRLPFVAWNLVDEGRELYAARCLACHDDYGHPRRDAPEGTPKPTRDLAEPWRWRRPDADDLRILVRHAAEGMPPLEGEVSEAEGTRLAAFVSLLSPGYELYDRYCLACHGLHGKGDPDAPVGSTRPGFAFDAEYFARRTPDWILDRTWHMLRDAKAVMPHFAPDLTDEEVGRILQYLRGVEP